MKPFTIEEAQTLKCPFGGGQGITMVRCNTVGCMGWEWVEFKEIYRKESVCVPNREPQCMMESVPYKNPYKGTCRVIYKEAT